MALKELLESRPPNEQSLLQRSLEVEPDWVVEQQEKEDLFALFAFLEGKLNAPGKMKVVGVDE